ncbi:hypothetical protein DOTSEDRAFT_158763 [Dothistroma septosporum NZE10]|uniref:Heterokaryon incompatibility domain-containing protein n=1 Tax=Dothistroma septosporum (strain NZE10 / CBS 128990) TaxID=675120 RepID=N1PDB2_DOTSN|nr:hypothetical protein DOTSEDRAFT_158763 [Dothistroma septosporum NZE10]
MIEVDGHGVTITRNAYSVLSLFCDWTQQRDRKAWVWIDAVCINQDDLLEKSVQVPLMASIYGKAKRTVVWLGDSNASTDLGMDLVRALAMGKNGYPVPQSIAKNSAAWTGFQEIASRPWWIRAWTLQESVIPTDTVYYCGTKCLTADEVRSAVLVVSSYSYSHSEVPLSKTTWAPLWHRRRIYQWLGHQDMDDDFDGYERQRPSPADRKLGQISLPALLAYQRHSLSTNPRDYLYSLLGCIKDKDKQLVGPPVYHSTTEEVYRNFVRSWVLAYQSLDILAFAELFPENTISQQLTHRLPSWAPDWSARLVMSSEESNAVPLLVSQPNKPDIGSMLPPRFLRRNGLHDPYGYVRGGKLPIYTAAGKMAMRVSFSKDMTHLKCTGILIDSIDGLSAVDADDFIPVEPSTSPPNLDRTEKNLHEQMDVACRIIDSLYLGRADVYLQYELDAQVPSKLAQEFLPTNEADGGTERQAWVDANEALKINGMTIRGAMTFTPKPDSHDSVSVKRSASPRDPPRRCPSRRSSPDRTSIRSDDSERIKQDEEFTEHSLDRKFRIATHRNWMAKRLAVTNTGHVGMVPQTARKNDIVCVLFGCSVPMVLRPVGDGTHKVVGEAYVHGFMDGEALEGGEYGAADYTLV